VLNNDLPKVGKGINNIRTKSQLTILNDSVFFYSEKLEYILFFSSNLMRKMFLIDNSDLPIGFRGSISENDQVPKIQNIREGKMIATTIVIDNITSAMIAEKKKILGSRVIIPKKIIQNSNYNEWDSRYQSMIFSPKASMKNIDCSMIQNESDEYYDLAWMIPDHMDEEKKFEHSIISFWENASFNEHASLHASATRALYIASKNRKNAIMTVANKLRNGILKKNEDATLRALNVKKYDDCLLALNIMKKYRKDPIVVGIGE